MLLPMLLAALAAATSPAPVPRAVPVERTTPAPPPADPCDGLGALRDDPACREGLLCGQRARVRLACAVRDALEQRYVFYPVKSRLLPPTADGPFDVRRHLDGCVAAERAVVREDEPLRFYDRMRRCVAGLEDGHLLLGAPVRLPQVALGLGLRLVDGKVYVANRERKLLSYLRTVSGVRDLDALLAVGNEVVAVDGQPVRERIEALAGLVPGSSPAARRERAVDALTRRDFDYPATRTAALTVMVDGRLRVVELPWWISPDAETNAMTEGYVRRTGIAATDLLAWTYDRVRDAWDHEPATAQGALRTDPILPAADAARLREYEGEGERAAVRLGEVVRRRDRAFCYLQILTFHTETLALDGERHPFAEVVEEFVAGCQAKGLDLVLDLRHNDGGYLAHTNAIVAALAPRGAPAPGGALLLRATTLNQLVYQQRVPALGGLPARAVDDALDPRGVVEAIGAARRADLPFTAAFLDPPIRASGLVGGFGGQVVALVSPTCSSACERLAGMLAANHRAVLVGGPTEGAGGSQQESPNLGARWTDPEGLLSLSIPNAAMGVQRAAGERGAPGADRFFEALAFENRPVQPDLPYATSLEDLTGANAGWLAQVEALLFGGADAASAPARAQTAAR